MSTTAPIDWPAGITTPASTAITWSDEEPALPTITATMPNGLKITNALVRTPAGTLTRSLEADLGFWSAYAPEDAECAELFDALDRALDSLYRRTAAAA